MSGWPDAGPLSISSGAGRRGGDARARSRAVSREVSAERVSDLFHFRACRSCYGQYVCNVRESEKVTARLSISLKGEKNIPNTHARSTHARARAHRNNNRSSNSTVAARARAIACVTRRYLFFSFRFSFDRSCRADGLPRIDRRGGTDFG